MGQGARLGRRIRRPQAGRRRVSAHCRAAASPQCFPPAGPGALTEVVCWCHRPLRRSLPCESAIPRRSFSVASLAFTQGAGPVLWRASCRGRQVHGKVGCCGCVSAYGRNAEMQLLCSFPRSPSGGVAKLMCWCRTCQKNETSKE
jgi:hypothetical protein